MSFWCHGKQRHHFANKGLVKAMIFSSNVLMCGEGNGNHSSTLA